MLTILIGINDTWRRYDQGDPTSAESFSTDYAAILESARSIPNLTRVVLMEPLFTPVTHEQTSWREEDLDAKIDVVRDRASRFGAELIPLDSIIAKASAISGPDAVVADGVHPTDAGNELIAQAWWAARAAHQGRGR